LSVLFAEGLLVRIQLSYAVCLVGGAAAGLFFGDTVFPQLEALVGDPLDDIVLGLAAALFAAIAWEMVSELNAVFPRMRRWCCHCP
jgi:hypothetical protein